MNKFNENIKKFDEKYKNYNEMTSLVSVHTDARKEKCVIRNESKKIREEYYKWQFIYTLIYSNLIPKEYIGTEVYFPKGSNGAKDIKLDGAIFDDINWFHYYSNYHNNKKDLVSLQWLREHLIMAIEIKKEDKNIPTAWEKQLKAGMKESERDICFGALYDAERLYLFKRINGKYIRLNDSYNEKKENSSSKNLSLHLTDSYLTFPSFQKMLEWNNDNKIDRSKRKLEDLDIISGVHSQQINNAMSNILREMDKQGLVNSKGYDILVQILSLKIYDEKYNNILKFYIDDDIIFTNVTDVKIQNFLSRIEKIKDDAEGDYNRILKDWDNCFIKTNEGHIKVLIEIVKQFQDFSFVQSTKTDLYQLVFYTFASQFSKNENAQFITPLPIIEFLVNIINPRNKEKIIDPTVGIADFLSVSYVNSKSKLDDNNIYGFDNDEDMVKLATLNMLLNGDGNAKIMSKPNLGSINTKFNIKGELIELEINSKKKKEWDERLDGQKLLKFDVVLTNPPFGDNRAFKPKDDYEKKVLECYELWDKYNSNKIDMGVIFLENAYKILKEDGRMGIVLSNSIASIDAHKIAREWLMQKMRIVAIFDLPANIFAETGVNTTIIVAYKPSEEILKELQNKNYEIFVRNINNVGYEIRTKNRVKVFEPVYKYDYETFEINIDEDGNPLLEEEFLSTVNEFKEWCQGQETKLIELFIKEK